MRFINKLILDLGSFNTRILSVNNERLIVLRTDKFKSALEPLPAVMGFRINNMMAFCELIEHILAKHAAMPRFLNRIYLIAEPNIPAADRENMTYTLREAGINQTHWLSAPQILSHERDLNLYIDVGYSKIAAGMVYKGELISFQRIEFGLNNLAKLIIESLEKKYKITVSDDDALRLIFECISLLPSAKPLKTELFSINVINKRKNRLIVNLALVYDCLEDYMGLILQIFSECLQELPPELAPQAKQQGVQLLGGGALIEGLAETLSSSLGLPFKTADNPVELLCLQALKLLPGSKISVT